MSLYHKKLEVYCRFHWSILLNYLRIPPLVCSIPRTWEKLGVFSHFYVFNKNFFYTQCRKVSHTRKSLNWNTGEMENDLTIYRYYAYIYSRSLSFTLHVLYTVYSTGGMKYQFSDTYTIGHRCESSYKRKKPDYPNFFSL